MADRDLTEDEVADLKEAFAMFDINGDGRWDRATTRKSDHRAEFSSLGRQEDGKDLETTTMAWLYESS